MPKSASKGMSWLGFVVVFVFIGIVGWGLFSVSNSNVLATVSSETVPDPSVDNSRGSGSKGFFDWVKALGYQPKVLATSYDSLPPDASVLVCIAPNMSGVNPFGFGTPPDPEGSESPVNHNPVTLEDAIAARKWLESGHTMLLFASSLPGSTVSAYRSEHAKGSSAPTTFAGELGVFPQSALQSPDQHKNYKPLQPSEWTEGVDMIHIHTGYRLYDPDHNGLALFSDEVVHNPSSSGVHGASAKVHSDPIAEVYPIGKGRIVAVSDDFFVCNRNIVRADNATLLYRILSLTARKGDTILFDEYHHAFGEESPSLWLALSKPVRYATLQLCLVLFVLILVLAPRLGQPVPLSGMSGRSSAEYVTSLAGLYQSAGVTTTALETIYRQFLREICQKFGLPTDTTLDRMAEVASRRGGVQLDGLRKLLVSCEKSLIAPVAIHGRDLVILARAIERYRKELGIG